MPEPSPTHPPTPTVESVAREKQASKAELMGELSVLYDCIRIAEHGPHSPILQQLAKCEDLASRFPSTCTEAHEATEAMLDTLATSLVSHVLSGNWRTEAAREYRAMERARVAEAPVFSRDPLAMHLYWEGKVAEAPAGGGRAVSSRSSLGDVPTREDGNCPSPALGRWTREPVAEDGWYWMRSPDYDWPAVVTFLRAREDQRFTHWSLPIALPPLPDKERE